MLKKLAKAFAPSRKIPDPLEEPFILEKDDSSSEAGTEFNNSGNITEQGASVNQFTKDEFAALFEACEKGSLEVVNKLIEENPALLNGATKDGLTALHQVKLTHLYSAIGTLNKSESQLVQ